MKSHITTLEELQGKPKSELHAIFRKAAETASAENLSPEERAAAQATLDHITKVLKSKRTMRKP